jgi:phosphatidylglycerophosphate synthase
MLTRFKERVQSLLATEAKVLHRYGFTPNKISAMGILFAFLAACSYWAWAWGQNNLFILLGALFFLGSGFWDALDGVMARLHGETTVFGGFLDSLLDRYADALIFIALIASGLCDPISGSGALVGSLLVSYARARAEATGIRMETVGFAERAERIIILTGASLLGTFHPEVIGWSITILAVLTNLTVLQRTIYFYNASKHQKS